MNYFYRNWSFMRWLRLIISFGFIIAFVNQGDWFLLFIASYFLVMTIFNIGCNGGACDVSSAAQNQPAAPSDKND